VNEAPTSVEEPADATRDRFEVAAYWHGLFEDHEPEVKDRERFEVWLAADSRNRMAYESVERSWAGMANVGVDARILIMRREALAAPQNTRARWFPATGIAASILAGAVLVGIAIRHGSLSTDPNSGAFTTQVGQRSTITLADGSTVVLNTASHIQVAFDAQVRRVKLLAGQAWFEVAKNQPRPFVVEAGHRKVTAHGTAFDVRLENHDQVQVTLIEGRVSVEGLTGSGAGLIRPTEHEDLLPGDQLILTAAGAATKRKTDVVRATSWRQGQIIFDDDTLATAVAEVNRYSVRKIILADPRLASLRMSGVFTAGHSESFVETVTGNFPIKVTADSDGRLLLTAAN
jgi:transmembrane sensor